LAEAIYIPDGFFKMGPFAQKLLRALLVVPEIGIPGQCVQFFQA